MQEERPHQKCATAFDFANELSDCRPQICDLAFRDAPLVMRARNDFERAICFAATVQMDSYGKHLFENLCRRLDV